MLAGSQDISTPDFTAKFASLPGAAACAIMALSAPTRSKACTRLHGTPSSQPNLGAYSQHGLTGKEGPSPHARLT